MSFCIQKVYDIINNVIDRRMWNAPNHTLYVDGVSGTGKTSAIIEANKYNKWKTDYYKVQKYNTIVSPDIFPPSTMGYIASGIIDSYNGGPKFGDRSPLNVLDWYILWILMGKFFVQFGNVRPNYIDTDMSRELKKYEKILTLYRQTYFYSIYSQHFNTMAIIHSNIDAIDFVRRQRGEGSDIERSTWEFYTFFQNLMYKHLYPTTHIDLDKFQNTNIDDVIQGLAFYLNDSLEYIVESRECKKIPISNTCLPLDDSRNVVRDNLLANAIRSIARNGCKQINNEPDDLMKRLTPFVVVNNIVNPNGTLQEPIIPRSFNAFFNNPLNYDFNNFTHDCPSYEIILDGS